MNKMNYQASQAIFLDTYISTILNILRFLLITYNSLLLTLNLLPGKFGQIDRYLLIFLISICNRANCGKRQKKSFFVIQKKINLEFARFFAPPLEFGSNSIKLRVP
jgi:hypothetical protein